MKRKEKRSDGTLNKRVNVDYEYKTILNVMYVFIPGDPRESVVL